MTQKRSKRHTTRTNRSVRKYAIGGRPITAAQHKDIEDVIVFSATDNENKPIMNADNTEKKLYVKKSKFLGVPKYNIYTNEEMTTHFDKKYSNLTFDEFSNKIEEIMLTHFGKEAGNIQCNANNLLFPEMKADHKFSKLNDKLCKDSALHKDKKGFFGKIKSKLDNMNLLGWIKAKPSKQETLVVKCTTAVNDATNAMINQARFANVGLIFSTLTVGTAAVSGLMVAAGASATTIVGLPVAAGLMALALVANQILRVSMKNKELQSVMYLIWAMCVRFENLVNLMIKMADKLDFDIDAALTPVRNVMARLITQICTLAPKSTFDEIQKKKTADGSYDITKTSTQDEKISEYSSRIDNNSIMGSLKRKLNRISSPDENYRVLIRDICILGIWFSIIFSEFMLVAGVRNDVIKFNLQNSLKMYDIENETDIPKKITFIQAQLDYMNDIHNLPEYKKLIGGPIGIAEKSVLRINPTMAELELKFKEMIDSKCDNFLAEMKKISAEIQENNTQTLVDSLKTDDMKLRIIECGNLISKSYEELSAEDSHKADLENFLPTFIEKNKMDPSQEVINALKDESNLTVYAPILLNYLILVETYTNLKMYAKVKEFEDKYTKLVDEIKKMETPKLSPIPGDS